MQLNLDPTTVWIDRAAHDPSQRHVRRLPETLDFSPWQDLIHGFQRATLPGTEIGCPLLIAEPFQLRFSTGLTWQARYPARLAEGWFVGTFHVHPPGREPIFDAQDLANLLRSDNAGFLDLLAVGERLLALVRTNPFLYVAAERVNRDPWLFRAGYEEERRRGGALEPGEPGYEAACRRAALYFCERYQLALYEGSVASPLRRTYTPRGAW